VGAELVRHGRRPRSSRQIRERTRDHAQAKDIDVLVYCACRRVRVQLCAFAAAAHELLHNAIQATRRRHPVILDVSETSAGDVLWQIRDSGHGMPKQVLSNLGKPPRSACGGSGLGVALAWEVIERHDGLLRFESAKGIGTTTSIWLPGARERRWAEALRQRDPAEDGRQG
jgi:signal transduction histidine kinase